MNHDRLREQYMREQYEWTQLVDRLKKDLAKYPLESLIAACKEADLVRTAEAKVLAEGAIERAKK